MELMIIFVVAAVFSFGIAFWADAWGRNPVGWFFFSFLVSPLLVAIILLIAGKTIEKRAEEQREINSHT